MAEKLVDPALFRLRALEVEWLEPLKAELSGLYDRSVESTPVRGRTAESDGTVLLLYVLIAEADRWITVGQQVGYFTRTSPSTYPLSLAEPPELQWLLDAIRSQPELPPGIGVREFARALSDARNDLTAERREFLRLVCFAEEVEWHERLNQIRTFADKLADRPEEFPPSEMVDGVTWGLDDFGWDISGDPIYPPAESGRAGSETFTMIELQQHLPAEWRSGSLSLVAKRSAVTGNRLAALAEVRASISASPAATPASEDDAPQGKELYQSGPWLVVFGHGIHSEARAHQVEDQCHARGVHSVVVPVNEVAGFDLSYYTALIIVLPSTPPEGLPAPSMGKIVEIIKTYRARRPDNLTSLLDGSRRWFEAGVVQVFGTHDAHEHAALESIADRICLVHRVDDDGPIDPFKVYQARGLSAATRPGSSDHLAHRLQAYLLSWGLSVPEDVPSARELIDGCRRRYEDPRFRVLRRPIQGRELNQLDFLLDEPDIRVPGHKKWMENGARVARDVFDKLEREFPNFYRPNDPGNKKNAQKDLRELYLALRTMEKVSKVPDQRSRLEGTRRDTTSDGRSTAAG